MGSVQLSIFLLSVACICLSAAVILLGVRIRRLYKDFDSYIDELVRSGALRDYYYYNPCRHD